MSKKMLCSVPPRCFFHIFFSPTTLRGTQSEKFSVSVEPLNANYILPEQKIKLIIAEKNNIFE